jgi:hypothetical protein
MADEVFSWEGATNPLSIFAYELRLLNEITCTPKIEREQRRLSGAHRVTFAAGVIDSCAGQLFLPNTVSASPLCDPGKRDVNLFVKLHGIRTLLLG